MSITDLDEALNNDDWYKERKAWLAQGAYRKQEQIIKRLEEHLGYGDSEWDANVKAIIAIIEKETDGMADTDMTKTIRLTAREREQLNKALEGEKEPMSCSHSQEGDYIACVHCDIERAGNEGYREGIAWERKRVEMAWHEEMACKCEDAMGHMKQRIYGEI